MSKDKKTKTTVVHHVVYSTKGGCGKTSFSLLLLLSRFLNQDPKLLDAGNCIDIDALFKPEEETEDPSEEPKQNSDGEAGEKEKTDNVSNYLFDVDFLGTSINAIIGGGNANNFIKMNDLIFNIKDVDELDLASNCITKQTNNSGTARYIIPSSDKESDKEKFHVKRRYTPLLKYDEFRYEVEAIVNKIKQNESGKSHDNSRRVLNFIYDMPPNSDGYTEALFDYLLQQQDESGVMVVLYLVSNNQPMLLCNIDWLRRFKATGKEVKFKYCLVCNDTDDSNKMTTWLTCRPSTRNDLSSATGGQNYVRLDPNASKLKDMVEKTMLSKNNKEINFCFIYNKYDTSVTHFNNTKPSNKKKSIFEELYKSYH